MQPGQQQLEPKDSDLLERGLAAWPQHLVLGGQVAAVRWSELPFRLVRMAMEMGTLLQSAWVALGAIANCLVLLDWNRHAAQHVFEGDSTAVEVEIPYGWFQQQQWEQHSGQAAQEQLVSGWLNQLDSLYFHQRFWHHGNTSIHPCSVQHTHGSINLIRTWFGLGWMLQ